MNAMVNSNALTARKKRFLLALFSFMAIYLFMLLGVVMAQQPTIVTGTVVSSATGLPILGVSVRVKNTNKGTITNKDGKYSIDVPLNSVLVISYVGYISQEVVTGRAKIYDIDLESKNRIEDEIVVTGYRKMRKIDFTGSVTQINGADLEKAPVANFAQALEGRVPGLRVEFPDGQPGESPTNDAKLKRITI